MLTFIWSIDFLETDGEVGKGNSQDDNDGENDNGEVSIKRKLCCELSDSACKRDWDEMTKECTCKTDKDCQEKGQVKGEHVLNGETSGILSYLGSCENKVCKLYHLPEGYRPNFPGLSKNKAL